ncbi:MAG: signal peptidase II [Lachnospiraceae bacterium]|jgi:signal peptidase II|nr:signal peptidase II [Lachnospiraceae bacterium]
MKNKKKYLIFIIITVVGIILDRITKIIAIDRLSDKSKVLIKDVLELRLLYNTGAAWSFMHDNTWFLTLFSILLSVILIVFIIKIPDKPHMTSLVVLLSFIVSGAIGNMIDRIAMGKVTDFIYFKLINFPIFNVADIWVSCSTAVLVLLIIFYYKDEDFEWLQRKK